MITPGRARGALSNGAAATLLAVALSGCATAAATKELQPAPATPACSVSDSDRAWIDRSLEAWRFASREITGIETVPNLQVIIFDERCVMRSGNALSGSPVASVTWTAEPHGGTVPMPDGSELPAGVTSFASGDEGLRYFVMSTPSIWSAAGVGEGATLETTMVAVLLHEASHVAQVGPYGPRLGALIERYKLPDSFNDNCVQERFKSNEEFAASVKRETELFMEAAEADDATEARRLMTDRKERWLTGDDTYLIEAEDIWLTFEGSGQWVAYRWMVDPRGGASPAADVTARYLRGRHWSQTEGFALVMALDRIAGPGWKRHAFGDGARTVLEMLDDALRAE
jgi:hypothetical protein